MNDLHRFGPLVVILLCLLAGKAMKQARSIPNWTIAPTLTLLGLVMGAATAMATGGDWRAWLYSTLLGTLSGAGAVGLHQAGKGIQAGRPSRPPAPPPLPLLAFLALLAALGCGPRPETVKLCTTSAGAVSRMDPHLLAIMRGMDDACIARPAPERKPCLAKVRSAWAPVRAELAAVRAAWCAEEPEKCR
jgi:hypothetical protein